CVHVLSAEVGTARCAVRAPIEGRNVCVTCACGAIGSARSDAGGDIAARCPYPLTISYNQKHGQMSRVFWLKPKRDNPPLPPVKRRRGVRGHSQVLSIVSGGQWPTIRPIPKTSSGSDL